MKSALLTCLLVHFCFLGFAQSKSDLDYIVMNGDTIFCVITDIDRAGANLESIRYLDDNYKEGKVLANDIKYVHSFRIANYIVDFIPLKPSNPQGSQRHIERKIDGKVIIYFHNRLRAKTYKNGKRIIYTLPEGESYGPTIYTIKIDKRYYRIDKSNIKKVIEPYLLKCEEFSKNFTEPVSLKNIEAAVMLYNELCK